MRLSIKSLILVSGYAATQFAFLNCAYAAPDPAVEARVKVVAKTIAAELSAGCPLADPASSAAFEACRQNLFHDSEFKRVLPDFLLWGRQKNPDTLLKNSTLTQFNPDVFSSMYMPMFMFNGQYSVKYDERENSYQIRLQTAFRNRLAPGEYPYPFWHEDDKWATYEKAKEIVIWWDAGRNRIRTAQFTAVAAAEPLVPVQTQVRPKFDGQWVWNDANGITQPKTSLFNGFFAANNPYLKQLDGAYKTFALSMRDGQCNECHVPNNPDSMKRLVLLQTPMHAAAEIKRILKSVREDRMPRDEVGIEVALAPKLKANFLAQGAEFDKLMDEAKRWEAGQKVSATTAK
jgi:hypothetical protein